MSRPDSRTNWLAPARLFAAIAVVFSHTFAIAGKREPMSGAGTTLGYLAVEIFFAMSGMLLTESLVRDPSILRYAAARALRIFRPSWWPS